MMKQVFAHRLTRSPKRPFIFPIHGYFAATTGNVTDEVIAKYIEEQAKMERAKDEDFKVDE